jgi:DnaJ homolog subfamily C member 3
MKAKIHTKDGHWSDARDTLKRYTSKVKGDQAATELLYAISEGEMTSKKVEKAMNAQLWTACTEAASQALKTASHSVEIRQQRAECALAAGDIESAVGDLTYALSAIILSTSLILPQTFNTPFASINHIFHANIPSFIFFSPFIPVITIDITSSYHSQAMPPS